MIMYDIMIKINFQNAVSYFNSNIIRIIYNNRKDNSRKIITLIVLEPTLSVAKCTF